MTNGGVTRAIRVRDSRGTRVLPDPIAEALLKLEIDRGLNAVACLRPEAAREYEQFKKEIAQLGIQSHALMQSVAIQAQQGMELAAKSMAVIRKAAIQAAEAIEAASRSVFEVPYIRKMIEMKSRAQRGDLLALEWTLETWGARPLEDVEIQNAINAYADKDKLEEKDKEFLKRIVSAFRRGLLKPHGGRPTKVDRELIPIVLLFQKLRQTCPVQLKKTYRNKNARRLAMVEISRHFAAGVPEEWKDSTRTATLRLLQRQQSLNIEFADGVAAEVLSCSPRLIRSLRKLEGSGKNP